MKNYAVVDIETTGLDPYKHEIIEIAILTETETYHVKVCPQNLQYADSKALEINGYNEKDWYGAVKPIDAAIVTSRLLDNKIIIGHNPSFDMSFLRELWDLYNCNPYIDRRCIDTVVLAREHLPYCRSYRLDHIREYLGWSTVATHSALVDVQDTKQLFDVLWRCSWYCRTWYRVRHWFVSWLALPRV